MSENLNRGARDFSKYDTMATADLEEILRLDAKSPEETESDTELLLYIMEVLADRRRNSGNAGKTAFEAWESFEKNYMPEEESSEVAVRKAGWHFAPWLRRSVAAIVIIVLFVCIPVTAEAFGLGDLWDVFARWAKETFSFVSGEDTQITEPVLPGEEGFTSLQDALIKSNRDPNLAPAWIPDNYSLDDIIKDVSPARETFIAYYTNGTSTIKILVQSYLSMDPEKIEITDDLVEIYPSAGLDYYIFSNYNELQVIWVNGSYECSITGDVSIDDIKLMIDSIGKE